MENLIKSKICTKCGKSKHVDLFYKRGDGGYKSECRKCSRIASDNWKKNNSENYKKSLKEKYNSRSNEERIRWKKNNPLAYLCCSAKSNAKRYSREFKINKEYLQSLWEEQHGLCYYTNKPMLYTVSCDDAVSIDRVDSSKGYIIGNIVLCRYRINVMKNNVSIQNLLQISEDIVKTLKTKIK